MAAKQQFLYPLIYTGGEPKDMSHIYFGRGMIFQLGPLSDMPGPLEGRFYADVTEEEGRDLVKRFPGEPPKRAVPGREAVMAQDGVTVIIDAIPDQPAQPAKPLFLWPEGTQLGPQTVTRDEYMALADATNALGASHADLSARIDKLIAQLGASQTQAAADAKALDAKLTAALDAKVAAVEAKIPKTKAEAPPVAVTPDAPPAPGA